LPEYLKTGHDAVVNNYRDWGIQLGRRFRALKLWFVICAYGVSGLRKMLADHLELARYFREKLEAMAGFEIMAPMPLNLICFRYRPDPSMPSEAVDRLNECLMASINNSGKAYLTHTKLHGQYVLRVCIGQTYVERRHVDQLLELLQG